MFTNKLLIILIFVTGLMVTMVSCKTNPKRLTVAEEKEFRQNLVKANRGMVDLDQDRIEAYVERRGWTMQTTKTGLWYEIYHQGNGEKAAEGEIAHLNYKISLLDGTVCYSSDSTGELAFKVGQGGVEPGLEEAILLMKVGDQGRFIMPPHLAHGLIGDQKKIPARSIIVYHAELLKLTNY